MPAIHDLDVDEYLYRSVSIDRSDINGEFARVSSDMAYWGEHYAQCERRHAEAKSELERIDAHEYRRHRAFMEANADGRVTEGMVKAAVLDSSVYRDAKDDLVDCAAAVVRAKGIIEAIKTKRDMLVSLGAQLRAERAGEPYIKTEDPTDEDGPDLWAYNTNSSDGK